ncbi:MAG: hypothetical protein JO095_14455 [Alphaproteobacteria bacterium]|nr:hypothetical protein [Alphaproteobacteria bacterium]MBV9816668.1 hypothetical protein [Alphaproteobacteria bacterium]
MIALLISPAGAQQAPQGTPTRIRGTVEKLDGQALTVKSREGQSVTIALSDNVAVAYLVKKNVGDIKPGDYIASTGIKGTDSKLHAIEVRIFPESLRGAGEGQYPWDLKPESVMTKATVGTITQAPQGNVIKVSYKGTESEYTVDPTTPIFANTTGDRNLLCPAPRYLSLRRSLTTASSPARAFMWRRTASSRRCDRHRHQLVR